MERRGFLNGFQLKCIMAFFMLLDHIYLYIPLTPVWFTWLGRLVAPTFCFLMTEGMAHTANRDRYVRRMALAGAAMFLGNRVLYHLSGVPLQQNIFWSLAISAGIIRYLDERLEGDRSAGNLILLALLLLLSVGCEGSIMIPAMALSFYYLRRRPLLMYITYAVTMTLLVRLLFYSMLPQIFMLAAVVPIAAYNGERGRNTPACRNFFYVFYPLHVWILFIVANFVMV